MNLNFRFSLIHMIANKGVALTLLLAVFFLVDSRAQHSEVEARLQGVFIEANKEKLLGNYDKAAELFEQVLLKDPENDVASFELSRVLNEAKRYDEAVKYAKKATSIDPENLWYTLYLGDLYHSMERYTEAAEVFSGLAQKYPENEEYPLKKAFFLVKANQPEEAIKVYEELEAKMGVNEELTRRKQGLYVGMGNTSKATKELEKLVEAFPQNTNYKHILAAYLLQIDEKGKAEKVYESILKINPNDAQAQLALKGGSKPSNDIDNFVAGLKPIFSNKEVGIDAKVKQIIPQIQMVANTGNKAVANGLLELTQDLEIAHPDEPKVYAIAGDLYFYTKDYENAKNKYAKALELDKSIYLVWEQYLISLEELEDYDLLANKSSDALDLFPNQGMLYYLNGLALRETGDNSAAIISLNQAKMMSGRIPHILYGVQIELGKAYHASNRYEKSDEAFKAALEMNAKDPFLLKNYAERLLERGEYPEKAREMAELANSLQPSNPDMESLMGWTFYQEGNYAKAVEWLNKAFNQKQDAEIAERLGDAYFQTGKSEEALKYWQLALDKNKDNQKLQQKIKDKALPK